MRALFPLLLLTACQTGLEDDTAGGDDTGIPGEGFCQVQSILADACTICHDATDPSGGLDLETDPWTALVGVPSQYDGRTLVVAGDPDGSFLYVKLQGAQTGGEGDVMPPAGPLSAAQVEIVRAWIADGASAECGSIDTGGGPYHPEGWDDPAAHGLGAKLQDDDCQSCHGETLDGGEVGVSCDTCHDAGWRSDCTYCHGGGDNGTGAPPEGIRDESSADELSFPAHTAHVEDTDLHAAFDCEECHDGRDGIFDAGHLFDGDSTRGVAEVVFDASLSTAGDWGGAGCSNLYCHGDGRRDNGSVEVSDDVGCGDCHATSLSENTSLSEPHGDHFEEGVSCEECHAGVVSSNRTVTDATLHVDGEVDVEMAGTVTWNGSTCSGSCHGEDHRSESW